MTFRFEKTFRTGHEIFDEISGFQIGSTICIFDETHTESLLFLEALLSKMKDTPICLLASQPMETSFRLINTEIEKPLNDINLSVAKLREEVETGIIIHHYLPHILLRVSEDEVLKMLEYWMQKISGKDFIEVFTLPKETYPTFEKRLKRTTYLKFLAQLQVIPLVLGADYLLHGPVGSASWVISNTISLIALAYSILGEETTASAARHFKSPSEQSTTEMFCNSATDIPEFPKEPRS